MTELHKSSRRSQNGPQWQDGFLQMLPKIQEQLRFAFRFLKPDAKEEAVQEGVANCLVRYERLARQGRADVAAPTPLAQFAIRQIRAGRMVASKLNCRELLSPYAQRQKGFFVDRLDQVCPETKDWLDAAVEDLRAPIPEQVALRIDVSAWLRKFTRPMRRIARELASGWSTGEMARRHGLSAARISQLRREFHESWLEFQSQESALALI